MGEAKNIIIKPISRGDANTIIKKIHYSGKVTQSTKIHFGVFYDGKCGGALSLGLSLDHRKMQGLVEDTKWNEFMELNRMALADWLPRNGESRAISVCLRLLKKNYPFLKWIVSFADATQCGDGTIYRASGFLLTAIKKNEGIYRLPSIDTLLNNPNNTHDSLWASLIEYRKCFDVMHLMYVQANDDRRFSLIQKSIHQLYKKITHGGQSSRMFFDYIGAEKLQGFQLRYIYFLDPSYKDKLTVPIIPFSRIAEMGAGMYKGVKRIADDSNLDQQGVAV